MNGEACEKLYEAYYMRVFSFAMTLAGDRHLAEEITQETFFRAFSRLSDFRGESDASTWLCAIARNLFTDEKRRQSRRGQEYLERALHAIEEPYREVFELRVFGELSFVQIGQIFSKTENWARVTYHRARMKLKERMETT